MNTFRMPCYAVVLHAKKVAKGYFAEGKNVFWRLCTFDRVMRGSHSTEEKCLASH